MLQYADLLLGSNGGMMGSGSQHFATVRDIGLLREKQILQGDSTSSMQCNIKLAGTKLKHLWQSQGQSGVEIEHYSVVYATE